MNAKHCSKGSLTICRLCGSNINIHSVCTKRQPLDSPWPPDPLVDQIRVAAGAFHGFPLAYRFSWLSKKGCCSHHIATGNPAVLQNTRNFRTPILVTSRCFNCICVTIPSSGQEELWSGLHCTNCCTLRIKRFVICYAMLLTPRSEAVPRVTKHIKTCLCE